VPPGFANPAQVFVAPVVLSLPAGSFAAIEIELGALGGFSQFQFFFSGSGFASSLGGAQALTPTPATPVFGPGLGSVTGSAGSGIGSGITSTGNQPATTTNSPTGTSITPLNPNVNSPSSAASNASSPALIPVVVVSPPIQPLVIHLAASSSPVTNIAFSTLLSFAQEQPTSITHFGQELHFPQRSLWTKPVEEVETSSLIDWVEPVKPAVPAGEKIDVGQPVEPAIGPSAARSLQRLTDRDFAALFDLSDSGSRTGRSGGQAAQSEDPAAGTYYSWSFSTVFGATVVAAGGYQLVIREADRFKARWTPRWVGAERPTRRKSGSVH
jgi:hypothetical protein